LDSKEFKKQPKPFPFVCKLCQVDYLNKRDYNRHKRNKTPCLTIERCLELVAEADKARQQQAEIQQLKEIVFSLVVNVDETTNSNMRTDLLNFLSKDANRTTSNEQKTGQFLRYLFATQPDLIFELANLCKSVPIVDEKLKQRILAKIKTTPRKVTNNTKKLIFIAQNHLCNDCKMTCVFAEVDHIIPLYLGGTNDYENLQALCPNCHTIKTIRDDVQFTSILDELLRLVH